MINSCSLNYWSFCCRKPEWVIYTVFNLCMWEYVSLCMFSPQVMKVSSSCSLVRLSSTSTLTTSQQSPPASCLDWQRRGRRGGRWGKRQERGKKEAGCHGNKGNLLLLCAERNGARREFEWAQRAFPGSALLSKRTAEMQQLKTFSFISFNGDSDFNVQVVTGSSVLDELSLFQSSPWHFYLLLTSFIMLLWYDAQQRVAVCINLQFLCIMWSNRAKSSFVSKKELAQVSQNVFFLLCDGSTVCLVLDQWLTLMQQATRLAMYSWQLPSSPWKMRLPYCSTWTQKDKSG